jgi:hypothetical protein
VEAYSNPGLWYSFTGTGTCSWLHFYTIYVSNLCTLMQAQGTMVTFVAVSPHEGTVFRVFDITAVGCTALDGSRFADRPYCVTSK